MKREREKKRESERKKWSREIGRETGIQRYEEREIETYKDMKRKKSYIFFSLALSSLCLSLFLSFHHFIK